MNHLFLLTDSYNFGTIASQLSCPMDVDFDYTILSKDTLTEHHIPENDFKNIFNACEGKDIIIIQVMGSQIIYLVDVLLSEKELSHSHFIILQSPLIDFYYRPSEDFFVDRAVRRKLRNYSTTFTIIRPFTTYFIQQNWPKHFIPEKYQKFLLPEELFFSQLLSEISKGTRQSDVTYFLSETHFPHSKLEQTVMEKLSLFFLPLFYFEIFKNRNFYKQWLEKDALMSFFKNAGKLQHKILINTESVSKAKQTVSHQINSEKIINLL